MIVTFVFPDWVDAESTIEQNKMAKGIGHFNFAISILSAVLKQNGHQTNLLHVCSLPSETEFTKMLSDKFSDTDLFAFSFSEADTEWVRQMAGWISRFSGKPIIGGGIFPTLHPEECLLDFCMDFVCVGEGEFALPEVCRRLNSEMDFDGISNIFYCKNGKVHRNPIGQIVPNLDDLPRYDFDIFDVSRLKNFASNLPRLFYLCTRNCPFGCAFCSNHAKRKAMGCGRTFVRRFSPERVVSDLKYFCERFPFIKLIHFADEILHYDKAYFKELMSLYRNEIGLPWRSYAMLALLDENTMTIMGQSGCARLNIGLESGSRRVRRIYNRPQMDNEEIIRRIARLKELGIDVHTSTLLGAPSETLDEILQTVKLAARAGTDIAVTGIVVPYRSTRLHRYVEDNGLLLGNYYENTAVSIRPFDTTPERIMMIYHTYQLLVELYKSCLRNPRIGRILEKVLDALLKWPYLPDTSITNVYLHHFKGLILDRAYRRTEKRLGRIEKSSDQAIVDAASYSRPGVRTRNDS